MTQSFSKVMKNDQAGDIAQFSVADLNGIPSPAQSTVEPAVNFPKDGDSSNEAQKGDTHSGKVKRPFQLTSTKIVTNRSSIRHDEGINQSIFSWSFPEIKRESKPKVEKQQQVIREQEDYSVLLDDAKNQADEIIAEAEKSAAAMMEEAKAEAEALRQKGFMEGMETAKNEVSTTMHQVERIFQETQLWQEQVMQKSQTRIMEMVLSIGKKLFGNGFELPVAQIDQIVSRAINEASRLGNLRIYLNPEDARLLVNLWQESEITLNGQQIQIVSSQNISRGGCFVDGQFGVVDGRVEEQMDQITKAIKTAETNLENLEPEE